MAKLSGHAVRPAKQLPIGEDPRSDSLRDIHDHQIVQAVAIAKPDLGERTGISYIVHLDVKAGGALDTRLDARYRPVQVGSEDKLFKVRVSAAGKTDTDPVERFVAVRRDQLANRRD